MCEALRAIWKKEVQYKICYRIMEIIIQLLIIPSKTSSNLYTNKKDVEFCKGFLLKDQY